MTRRNRTATVLVCAVAALSCAGRPHAPPKDAGVVTGSVPTPEPALPAIARLFDHYTIVGLSDLHGCAEVLDLVGQLVQDESFLDRVNDITWEPGNVRYQGLMDEFILGGADLSREQLSPCWRNNTQSHTYSDTPALFELLRMIRQVNLRRPRARQLRVLLIDPPIDWSRIRTREDVRTGDFDREHHMAQVLETEVYTKGRKALFFAGGTHLSRGAGPTMVPFDAKVGSGAPVPTDLLVSPLHSLELRHPGTTFNIAIHEGFGARTAQLEVRLATWPRPTLVRLSGTWWGELEPPPAGDVFVGRDGKPVKPRPGRKLQESWDAVLFLGRRAELTRVDPPGRDVLDEAWLKELERRHEIMGGPTAPRASEPPKGRQFFPPSR